MDAIEQLVNLGRELQGLELGVTEENRERKLQYAQESLLRVLLVVSEAIWNIRKENGDEDENEDAS